MKKIIGVCFINFLLIGCSHIIVPKPDDPNFAPIIPDIALEPTSQHGSTYVDGYGLNLYQDIKAHKVGDILTVKLEEETKSSKDAKTNYDKTAEVGIDNPTLFGNELTGKLPNLPLLNSKKRSNLETTIKGTRNFKGKGDSGQNNSLTGDITVTIAQVLPNKNLVIRGEKWLTLNQGSEYIRLTGIVRPQDIDPNNTVKSTRIANARITYSGTGVVAEANKAGWLAKFFNSSWWPF